jgi:hypothetical protein
MRANIPTNEESADPAKGPPLWRAAAAGQHETAQMLVMKHAEFYARHGRGRHVIGLALAGSHRLVAGMIENELNGWALKNPEPEPKTPAPSGWRKTRKRHLRLV